jgi:endonuclease YncB( thermonuclease family)
MTRTRILAAMLALVALAPWARAMAADVPDCAGNVEVSAARIVRTEQNGVLVMSDGRAAQLEGIRIPNGRGDREPVTFQVQALTALSQLANDHPLTLTAVEPKEDRYDRIRAQAFSGPDWIQVALLKRGLARVSIAPDRIECAAVLYNAEGQARTARAGLWALPTYSIRTPQNVVGDIGTFQLVEGKATGADVRNGVMTLSFGIGLKGEFHVTISNDDMANFRMIGVNPKGYAGKAIRVRGIVQNDNGPMIEVANPMQIELVQ